MKRTAILLAGAAFIAVPAQARDGEVYIGIEGGVLLEDQVDIDLGDTDPQVNAAFADTATGYDIDAVVGYDFGAFRLEAEGSYKQAGIDTVTFLDTDLIDEIAVPLLSPLASDDDVSVWSGMVNGLVEYGKDDGFQIYGGGGVGVANLDIPLVVPGTTTAVIDDSSTEFAWQLLAGFRYAINDRIDIGVKYRYFVIDEFELEGVNGSPLEADFQTHSVLASLLYNFGSAPEPTPVVAPPAPTPPPPPPPVVRPAPPPPKPVCNTGPYIVFFDFDKSDITPEAAGILNNAVTAYANCGNARVMLAGHTDKAGSARYNVGLAERRNMAVRSYMTGRGVPAAQISGEAFGETMPRVPTADGVREAQNRRVEVTYGPGSGR